jgi:hypothetical protein
VCRTSSTRVVVMEVFSYKVTSVGVTIFMPGTVVEYPTTSCYSAYDLSLILYVSAIAFLLASYRVHSL